MAKILMMVMFSVFAINLMNAAGTSSRIAHGYTQPGVTMYAMR